METRCSIAACAHSFLCDVSLRSGATILIAQIHLKEILCSSRSSIHVQKTVHLIDKIYRLNRASLQMSEELGREPTDEELAEEIGISSEKLSPA